MRSFNQPHELDRIAERARNPASQNAWSALLFIGRKLRDPHQGSA
jgi:hypothetical protein